MARAARETELRSARGILVRVEHHSIKEDKSTEQIPTELHDVTAW